MRTTTGTIRRLVAAVVTAAIPTVGLALPASAAGPSASLKISDVSVTEGNTGTVNAVFTISANNLKGSATVQWATITGTAGGADFVAGSGTVSLSKNARNVRVTVKVKGDVIDEPDETFTVQLSAPTGATIADATGVGTILDNDAPPAISVSDAVVSEAAGSVGILVTMSGATAKTVTVDYATTAGSATEGEDYTAVSGTLTIPAGTAPDAIDVPVLDDATDEPDETFQVALSLPTNATVSAATAQVTISDDDATPTISVGDVSVDEAAGTATFDVSLSNPSSASVSADYATGDGSAVGGEDYTAASGTVTFDPGETTTTIDVTIDDDATDEPTQTFDVTLTNPSGATVGDGTAVGSILDNDGGPGVTIENVVVSEASGTATFTLTLDAPSELTASVDYTTVEGTAVAGADYTTVTGTATFDPGETTFKVDVPILDDTIYEPSETFGLKLDNAHDVVFETSTITQATGSITDDEKAPAKLTVAVRKTTTSVVARGLITYATLGMKIRVTLLKRAGGHWVKVAAKTVGVGHLGDRNADGVKEGSYTAKFKRPTGHGRFRLNARFAGNASTRACAASKRFRL